MEILGTKVERVKVDVSDTEIRNAFLYLCDMEDIDEWRLENDQLVKYEDISTHGSCCWVECARIKDPEGVRMYVLLKEVLEILDKRKTSKKNKS